MIRLSEKKKLFYFCIFFLIYNVYKDVLKVVFRNIFSIKKYFNRVNLV